MALPDVAEIPGRAEALDRPAKAIGGTVARVLRPGAVKDALSGTWLGHPLHPMLSDVTLGAWTSALVLDLVPGRAAGRAADTLVGAGILSALPTALTGLSDWTDTWDEDSRTGLVHAALNLAALMLYSGSYLARRGRSRGAGVVLGALGAGLATAASYLGGHLTFRRGVGVDRTAFEERPRKWTAVADLNGLGEGKLVPVGLGDARVLLIRMGRRVHAIAARCTHRGGPLEEGSLEGDEVTCPWHGSRFRLSDGEIVRGPATAPQPCYETRVRGGRVEVRERR